ncbi:symmetrical bis(5'-nucleosyl)-tetraphosphatase [Vibrio salinus]|uniref:symmetrical bis(5'-nucleosyl)-tetraphosphatase n=1 Tax=Vibrio salinus TaxID=2899784 RepID=UPI001E394E06|nr:symmetrical bis(5'-nucleosyl)-tetraphosphatase [Vibrio salinus]MCE0494113.1 symmetrical bis(5'-nucleosyl)-tetraphosphatase [Vibrio salinus]
MANYIVGDIQGCLDELKIILKDVNFSKKKDTLWLAGDLVARGPKSLETLRFIKSLGKHARVVLGNHDLHLLAVSLGIHPVKAKDKTKSILNAPDRQELIDWLRHQPILAEHKEFVICHAGISPQWTLETARKAARDIEHILKNDEWRWLIENMYSDKPSRWKDNLNELQRLRYSINAFTRMRFVHPDGSLDMECKLPPDEADSTSLLPWFQYSHREKLSKPILFGHWAALNGVYNKEVIGLDTGCVWGGHLTMLRWEDKRFFTQQSLNR